MKFRNYVPHDKHLQEGKLAPAVLPKFEDPVASAPEPESQPKEVLYLVPLSLSYTHTHTLKLIDSNLVFFFFTFNNC